jgi:hypothetical protein
VAGSGECGDEPLGYGVTELVNVSASLKFEVLLTERGFFFAATKPRNALHGHEHKPRKEAQTSKYSRCGKYIVCLIVYALSKLLSGVSSTGRIGSVFHGTPQVKVNRIRFGDLGGHNTRASGR